MSTSLRERRQQQQPRERRKQQQLVVNNPWCAAGVLLLLLLLLLSDSIPIARFDSDDSAVSRLLYCAPTACDWLLSGAADWCAISIRF
jgi:hypothetical protein